MEASEHFFLGGMPGKGDSVFKKTIMASDFLAVNFSGVSGKGDSVLNIYHRFRFFSRSFFGGSGYMMEAMKPWVGDFFFH